MSNIQMNRDTLISAVENENVKVSYTVDRERKEIIKGVMGAIAGAGLGGLIGNVLQARPECGDAITGAIGGAAAVVHTGRMSGWEESKNERTNLPQCLPRQ